MSLCCFMRELSCQCMCMLFGCRFLFKFVPAFAQISWFKTLVRK